MRLSTVYVLVAISDLSLRWRHAEGVRQRVQFRGDRGNKIVGDARWDPVRERVVVLAERDDRRDLHAGRAPYERCHYSKPPSGSSPARSRTSATIAALYV